MRQSSDHATFAELCSIAANLSKRLGGYWTSQGAMCRCPAHEDRSPSLSIRVGRTALLFKCFAGCDTLDVLRALRTIDDRVLSSTNEPGNYRSHEDREAVLRDRARDIWDQSRPLAGTMAQAYLKARGFRSGSPALRFNPRTPLGSPDGVTYRPAMIAALHEEDRLVAVQRGFLDPGADGLAVDLGNPRRLLGRPFGGAVRLSPAGHTLGLAEGVETALSASVLLGIPVWATLGNERLPHVRVPDDVKRLVILPDNDRGGRIGAAKAEAAYLREGRLVETHWPPGTFNDWNDVLRARRAAALA